MVNMTVAEFISALGSKVQVITCDNTQSEGVVLSEDELTANVYNVAISGKFNSSNKIPNTVVTIDFKGLNTTNVTSMNSMFKGCSKLTSLDVSSFNTNNVTDMNFMFAQCNNITSFNLSNFNTSNVTSIDNMFTSCFNLTSLNLSSFDTSNVKSMVSLFSMCKSLKTIDLSSFNTSTVVYMTNMFHCCYKLISLNLSNFDTNNVTNMSSMFGYCYSLTSLDLSSFDTSNVSNYDNMFNYDFIKNIFINPNIWTLSKSKTAYGGNELHFYKYTSETLDVQTIYNGKKISLITLDDTIDSMRGEWTLIHEWGNPLALQFSVSTYSSSTWVDLDYNLNNFSELVIETAFGNESMESYYVRYKRDEISVPLYNTNDSQEFLQTIVCIGIDWDNNKIKIGLQKNRTDSKVVYYSGIKIYGR